MKGANGQLLLHPGAARAGLPALALFQTYGLVLSGDPESGEQNLQFYQ